MSFSALTVAAALVLSGSAIAESPFVGSWKMDVARSDSTGDTITYTRTANGYHFSNGFVDYDFAIDGKPYPVVVADRSTTWTEASDGGWDSVFIVGDMTRVRIHQKISADGSTLMTASQHYLPDGTTAHESNVYKRVSGGPGLVGTWKSNINAAGDRILITPAGQMSYRLDYSMRKVVVTAQLDGTPVFVDGPTVTAGETFIFRKSDAGKWTYSNRLWGNVVQEGILMVSPDGATLTDTSWMPGKEAERQVSVYGRE